LGKAQRVLAGLAAITRNSGLSDAEIHDVDAFVRRNMIEKWGPERTVASSSSITTDKPLESGRARS
jgi:hypothetical protein